MERKIPQHVAIIPDGNRRWARARGLKPWEGHVRSGRFDNLNPLFQEAEKLGIKYLTFWGFSTENWKRDKKEVDILMRVILKGLNEFDEKMDEMKIRFVHIGRKDRLLKKLVDKLNYLEEETRDNTGLNVILCLDYGGKDEIIRAVNKILKTAGHLGDMTEKSFKNYLDTKSIPDPDLIVRTGGERRLSGFMPFQSDYSELYFTDIYFPDFNVKELRKAVRWFSNRNRRFGE